MTQPLSQQAACTPWAAAVRLTIATAGLAALLAGLAWLYAGAMGAWGVFLAAMLCLCPGWLVFAMQSLYGTAAQGVALVMSATLVRMLFILGGIVAVRLLWPAFPMPPFLAALGLLYIMTLWMETHLLVAVTRTMNASR